MSFCPFYFGYWWHRRGCERMVIRFTTTYVINAWPLYCLNVYELLVTLLISSNFTTSNIYRFYVTFDVCFVRFYVTFDVCFVRFYVTFDVCFVRFYVTFDVFFVRFYVTFDVFFVRFYVTFDVCFVRFYVTFDVCFVMFLCNL